MDKVLVASSPSIEGNIGSCSTQAVEAQTNIFERTVILTNSCSGEIIKENSYIDILTPLMFIIIGIVVYKLFIAKDSMFSL